MTLNRNDDIASMGERDSAGRAWGKNILAVFLVVAAMLALFFPDRLQPLPEVWLERALAPAKTVGLRWIEGLLTGTGVACFREGNTFYLPSGFLRLGADVWALRRAPLLTLMLLAGACLAAWTWPIGAFRKGVLLAMSVLLSPLLLLLLDVVYLTTILQIRSGGVPLEGYLKYALSSEARIFVAVVVLTGFWVLVKALVTEEEEVAPARKAGRCPGRLPPLLWAALISVGLLVPLSLLVAVGAALVEGTWSLPLAFGIRAILCAGGGLLLLLAVLGRRSSGRLAWVPLAVIGVTGGDFPTALAFMVTVIALNDRRMTAQREA